MHLFTTENAPPVDKTKLGFFITASKADTALEADITKGGCLLDDLDHTLVLFTFADMAEHLNAEGDEYKFSYTIADGKQGEYSLYYTNCVPNTAVSFEVIVELFNPMAGGGKDYLSAGEKPLSCYCFTTDAGVRDRVLEETSSGSVNINDVIMHMSNHLLRCGMDRKLQQSHAFSALEVPFPLPSPPSACPGLRVPCPLLSHA